MSTGGRGDRDKEATSPDRKKRQAPPSSPVGGHRRRSHGAWPNTPPIIGVRAAHRAYRHGRFCVQRRPNRSPGRRRGGSFRIRYCDKKLPIEKAVRTSSRHMQFRISLASVSENGLHDRRGLSPRVRGHLPQFVRSWTLRALLSVYRFENATVCRRANQGVSTCGLLRPITTRSTRPVCSSERRVPTRTDRILLSLHHVRFKSCLKESRPYD